MMIDDRMELEGTILGHLQRKHFNNQMNFVEKFQWNGEKHLELINYLMSKFSFNESSEGVRVGSFN